MSDEKLRASARDASESGIQIVFNHGRERPGLIPLWVGEGDQPTPDFICNPTMRSLREGETYYTNQRGEPDLREAIARYYADHFAAHVSSERVIVTGGGMQAIHMAMQSIAGAGDSVVIPSPAWPNAASSVELNGAVARFVKMQFSANGWVLDIGQLMAACDDTTKAIFINSPSNPTGWVMSADDMRSVLDFARKRGLWIISDEVYARYYFGDAARSPSFLDVSEPGDRILYCNTFSKNWSMTGWRIGWLVVPEKAGVDYSLVYENLVQYNTSGVATFMQRGAATALRDGESYLAENIEMARIGREIITDQFNASNRIDYVSPEGAIYGYFSVRDFDDTAALAMRLIDEAGIGLAPGTAFGPGGENFFRLCFLRKERDVREAMSRLADWLER